jgi:hypothetical protein
MNVIFVVCDLLNRTPQRVYCGLPGSNIVYTVTNVLEERIASSPEDGSDGLVPPVRHGVITQKTTTNVFTARSEP